MSHRFNPNSQRASDIDGDGTLSPWERDRLCHVRVDGEPLKGDERYRVVLSDFLVNGGDHLGPAIKGAKTLKKGPMLRELLTKHLKSFDGCVDVKSPLIDPGSPRIIAGQCTAEERAE